MHTIFTQVQKYHSSTTNRSASSETDRKELISIFKKLAEKVTREVGELQEELKFLTKSDQDRIDKLTLIANQFDKWVSQADQNGNLRVIEPVSKMPVYLFLVAAIFCFL